jgi:transposase
MYKVLDKYTIEMEIVPILPLNKRGFTVTVPMVELVNAILYKLKTGIQWHQLPVKSLFEDKALTWEAVYYHYNKWSKAGIWKESWIKILNKYKSRIDLSSCDLDGSHTTALKGGEKVSYQGRKKRKTTNALYLTDRQGIPLAMSEPISGEHNDLFNIEIHFEEITATLEKADIEVDGLFMNADAGFDSNNLREISLKKGIIANVAVNKRNKKITENQDDYFDDKLYKERYSIERTNAWMDSFRSLLNRFDTSVSSWTGFNYLAFIIIALKKLSSIKV